MHIRFATRYLVAITRQLADLEAEVALLRNGEVTEARRAALAAAQMRLRQARRKQRLLLADPLFPDVPDRGARELTLPQRQSRRAGTAAAFAGR